MVSSTMFCDRCGAMNRAQAKFCIECGGTLQTQPFASGMPDISNQHMGTGLLSSRTQLLNRYTIQRPLGQGGMGAVYLVEDGRFGGALRAVKELSQNGLMPQERQAATAAFEQEAILLARLNHPHLPRIYDHFNDQGRWYLVMDYIDGETLEERLEKAPKKRLRIEEALEIGSQLCSVLHYLHTLQPPVIFRDLKPANIMLAREDHVYLIDFGIARLFKPHQKADTTLFGSPGYAAPEQYGRTQTSARADIYSLGVNMLQMLSGIDPSIRPLQLPEMTLPALPGTDELKALVKQMTNIDENKRPADASKIKQSFQSILLQLRGPRPNPGNNRPRTNVQAGGNNVQQAANNANVAQKNQNNRPNVNKIPPPQSNLRPQGPSTTEIVVDKAGTGQYTSINDALKNARPHTRIVLLPGIYQESVVLSKPLQLVGRGDAAQIVIESLDSCIQMNTDTATIRGLTLRGQGQKVVDIPQGQLLIENCNITSNSNTCNGIVIHNSNSNPTVKRCNIREVAVGIWAYDQAQGLIEDCTVRNTTNSGITVQTSTKFVIRRCKVHDVAGNGIHYTQSQGFIEECEIYNTTLPGIGLEQEADPMIRKCVVRNIRSSGLYIYNKGKGTIENCDIFKNERAGIHINTESSPVIRRCKIYNGIANGLYITGKATGIIEACDFFGNASANICTTSEANPIIRQCKIYDCVDAVGVYVTSGGKGVFKECDIKESSHKLVYVEDNSHPVFSDCKIHNGKDSAVYVENSQATFEKCTLDENGTAGIVIGAGGNPALTNCTISNNKLYGVYINDRGAGLIRGCTFANNGTWASIESANQFAKFFENVF